MLRVIISYISQKIFSLLCRLRSKHGNIMMGGKLTWQFTSHVTVSWHGIIGIARATTSNVHTSDSDKPWFPCFLILSVNNNVDVCSESFVCIPILLLFVVVQIFYWIILTFYNLKVYGFPFTHCTRDTSRYSRSVVAFQLAFPWTQQYSCGYSQGKVLHIILWDILYWTDGLWTSLVPTIAICLVSSCILCNRCAMLRTSGYVFVFFFPICVPY